MTACVDCSTAEGCEEHRMFRCSRCRRVVSWDVGGSPDEFDPNGEMCSDCWVKAAGISPPWAGKEWSRLGELVTHGDESPVPAVRYGIAGAVRGAGLRQADGQRAVVGVEREIERLISASNYEVCQDCHGNQRFPCSVCRGGSPDCERCEGSDQEDCPRCSATGVTRRAP